MSKIEELVKEFMKVKREELIEKKKWKNDEERIQYVEDTKELRKYKKQIQEVIKHKGGVINDRMEVDEVISRLLERELNDLIQEEDRIQRAIKKISEEFKNNNSYIEHSEISKEIKRRSKEILKAIFDESDFYSDELKDF